ncbi:MAG: hypothetical protein JWM56_350 [Candidatus Peribacteria bacterium]|nr:hypothetical protein [Candidatus Peribacteria bacterium]
MNTSIITLMLGFMLTLAGHSGKQPVGQSTLSALRSQRSSARQAVDLWIDTVMTQGWAQGGGIYRVIKRNTEEDPCLTAESIQYGGNPAKILYSKTICGMQVGTTHYDFHNVAAIDYTNLAWRKDGFHFTLEDDTRAEGILFFNCVIRHFETDPNMQCVPTV